MFPPALCCLIWLWKERAPAGSPTEACGRSILVSSECSSQFPLLSTVNKRIQTVSKEIEGKERPTPFGVNFMRSQMLYRAAQGTVDNKYQPCMDASGMSQLQLYLLAVMWCIFVLLC